MRKIREQNEEMRKMNLWRYRVRRVSLVRLVGEIRR